MYYITEYPSKNQYPDYQINPIYYRKNSTEVLPCLKSNVPIFPNQDKDP